MRYLPVLLVLVACNALGADTPEKPAAAHDGAWLQSGIKQYLRSNAHESLSDSETMDAMLAMSYVCAVVDLEKYLVLRADLLASALEDARKKEHHIDPEKIDGMAAALTLLIPLMQTGFTTESPSCDRVIAVVGDYLDRYPEVLTKGADEVVEGALLEAYPRPTSSSPGG